MIKFKNVPTVLVLLGSVATTLFYVLAEFDKKEAGIAVGLFSVFLSLAIAYRQLRRALQAQTVRLEKHFNSIKQSMRANDEFLENMSSSNSNAHREYLSMLKEFPTHQRHTLNRLMELRTLQIEQGHTSADIGKDVLRLSQQSEEVLKTLQIRSEEQAEMAELLKVTADLQRDLDEKLVRIQRLKKDTYEIRDMLQRQQTLESPLQLGANRN